MSIVGDGVFLPKASGGGGGPLPDGYELLGYLESDGTQYIDTGYTPNINTELTAIFMKKRSTLFQANYVCGDRKAQFGINVQGESNHYVSGIVGNKTGSLSGFTNSLAITCVKLSAEKIYIPDGGSSSSIGATELMADPNTLKMFCASSTTGGAMNYFVGRIYKIKIYDGNTTMMFLPAKRTSDNVVGMYDIVGDNFYVNSGSGNFTYGSVLDIV